MYIPQSIKTIIGKDSYTLDTKGKSGATVMMLTDYVLKIEDYGTEGVRECGISSWLEGKLRVPSTIEIVEENGKIYRLMERLKGKDLSSPCFLYNPSLLIDVCGKAYEALSSVDISTCPFTRNLDVCLEEAEERVENGKVDLDDVDPQTFGKGGFASPEALLMWLMDNKIEEEPAFMHGDLCLPNIFLLDDGDIAFIDLGRSGVGDRANDVALLSRSIKSNFLGSYNGGISYPGYNEKMLFERLGIKKDEEKIRYYLLLDELF